ncbi:cleavage stimulation factor subunit 2 [Candida albicans P57072]|nr:cleavage stimulation factor subunit 2 [Candida albicans P57072]KGR23248.1 cleavage stimulation factor subunit 2 [Candida albicans P37037]KGU14532.1 cleavage stimulation factor subunit 2 [Candida albicans P87]KGU18438.1 cleavage stimulation factor subunit 2 [Candida albicans L26]KGU19546.1 cleavage stimulation factor subunit 2 [Candida albicans 19F]KGU36373.1 cleavage stimulation factor subunit 2 [Candida albicans P75063]KHC43024.1 cleavage stimulation factor subunit 2 [Candida albicans P76
MYRNWLYFGRDSIDNLLNNYSFLLPRIRKTRQLKLNMDSKSTCVSIGKFPFDYTEEQVRDIARSVGPVLDVKLLFDELTGKSKGYAIINYGDNETASSAVRNLNYMTLPNGRFLKCSFVTDYDMSSKESVKLPPLPLGIQIHPNQNASQVISTILSNIDSNSALQILKEIKVMSIDNPESTKVLLERFPQLSLALVELGLLSNTTNQELIELTLNKRPVDLTELSLDHVRLLQSVEKLTDEEIDELDESQQEIVRKVKEEIAKGTYGEVSAVKDNA